eukprot:m.20889 g.20889  ORF g.20889 m.20889 type:complete len:235 (+) comp3874_c0_seq1:48-752(+)
MDYAQEQADEIEALQSIFPEDIAPLTETQFVLTVRADEPIAYPEDYEDQEATDYIKIKVSYTATYPDEAPELDVTEAAGSSDEQLEELTAKMNEAIEDSLGMPMVFSIHAAAKEWLEARNEAIAERIENERRAAAEAAAEAELAELTKGTLVTADTFEEWRLKFMEEFRAKQDPIKAKKLEMRKNRLTGRQLFERDSKLAESGNTLIEDDEVDIDESVFADLGDLGDDLEELED